MAEGDTTSTSGCLDCSGYGDDFGDKASYMAVSVSGGYEAEVEDGKEDEAEQVGVALWLQEFSTTVACVGQQDICRQAYLWQSLLDGMVSAGARMFTDSGWHMHFICRGVCCASPIQTCWSYAQSVYTCMGCVLEEIQDWVILFSQLVF